MFHSNSKGWYLVWKIFLSRFRFLRELLLNGSDGAGTPEKKEKLKRKHETASDDDEDERNQEPVLHNLRSRRIR